MLQKMNQFRQRALIWIRNRDALTRPGRPLPELLEQRALNDQLMLLERVFLLARGLPGRPEVRHALFSPAKFDLYGRLSAVTKAFFLFYYSSFFAVDLTLFLFIDEYPEVLVSSVSNKVNDFAIIVKLLSKILYYFFQDMK
jgi:hypothetical protein